MRVETGTGAAPDAHAIYEQLAPGDMVLVGARPGHGKTLLALRLAVEAMKAGKTSAFFTLEYTEDDTRERLRAVGGDAAAYGPQFVFDASDAISADYLIEKLADIPRGTLVVVDYLQILDQTRDNPDLATQIGALKAFAGAHGIVLVFIAQIDPRFETTGKACPDLEDVRLPNPLDLSLFSKACFLNGHETRFHA